MQFSENVDPDPDAAREGMRSTSWSSSCSGGIQVLVRGRGVDQHKESQRALDLSISHLSVGHLSSGHLSSTF